MDANEKILVKFVEDQIEKWARHKDLERARPEGWSVITFSKEPGSQGNNVARAVAEKLGFDFFDRDIMKGIAKSARISEHVIETLEKDRMSGVEDFLASLIQKHYIHPDIYMEHLMKVIATIGKHGRAVIVGRGANFILPLEERFSVRVVAPFEIRVRNVAGAFGVSIEEAKRRVMQREARRQAFIRQSFHTSITDPIHYDLIVNTQQMKIEAAVKAVCAAFEFQRARPTR
jgi:cytidylate kinase